LNAGLGNFGVTTMQIVIPLVMTMSLLGEFGGESLSSSKTVVGFLEKLLLEHLLGFKTLGLHGAFFGSAVDILLVWHE
jgi:nitrate/nitrite transporter NarK